MQFNLPTLHILEAHFPIKLQSRYATMWYIPLDDRPLCDTPDQLCKNSAALSSGKLQPLCCFQTSLPLAASPLWWWILYNCASATRRRGKTKRWVASSQSINILATLPKAADSWLLFNLRTTSLVEKTTAAWLLRAATLKQQAAIRRWNAMLWAAG